MKDKQEPTVQFATIRCAEDAGVPEYHIECRMSDNQKAAFVTVDGEFPILAATIAAMLNKGRTHLTVPVQSTEALRRAAMDIGEGYELSGAQIMRIYQAMLAEVVRQAQLACPNCDGLSNLYTETGVSLGPCPACAALPVINFD